MLKSKIKFLFCSVHVTSLCDFRHFYSEKKIELNVFFVVMRSLSSSL